MSNNKKHEMKYSALLLRKGFTLLILTLVLVSCGSQKYVDYDDGIYNGSPEPEPNATQVETNQETSAIETQYYKNYFGDTVKEVDDINNDAEIFTDVESYASEYVNDSIAEPQNFTNNGGWGSTTSEVIVNTYNTGWGIGIGFGWGWGWGWGGWYGPGWGWGYPPYYGCYYPPYYGHGYGYGYGSYVNSRRGNSYIAEYGRSTTNRLRGGDTGARTSSLNRSSRLASTDYRGRRITRLSEPRLNTTISRNTVASNNSSRRSRVASSNSRYSYNPNTRSYSRNNSARSSSNRNGTVSRNNSRTTTRSSRRSSRNNNTYPGINRTRSTYGRSSSSGRSSYRSSGGSTRSSGGVRSGGGGGRSSGGRGRG